MLRPLALSALSLLAACGPGGSALDAGDARPVDAVVVHDTPPVPDVPPPDAPPVERTTVTLPMGAVRGVVGAGYREFLGIPYAAPPVGALRWRPPQPPAPWSEPLDASVTPPRCAQLFLLATPTGQEDCLYLNVHTPSPAPSNAPVMVWLHGGGFLFGEGTQIDGATRGDILAREHGAVVVTVNYRLGPLGFMAHPALTAEGGGHSGNYGLMDQRAALQWVRDNIRSFGGDPGNVTLFGESAGGISVCSQMASPMSAGLFHRAVVQSGPCGLPIQSLAQAETDGNRVARTLGCTGTPAEQLACMRNGLALRVFDAVPTPPGFFSWDPMYVTWGPILDGAFFTDTPMNAFRSGNFQRVSLVTGHNSDEGTLFVTLANQVTLTAEQYTALLRLLARGDEAKVARIAARYPAAHPMGPWRAYATALGDYAIRCASDRALRAMLPHLPRAWAYQFDYQDAVFQLPSAVPLGAFHSAEIQYVFGHPGRAGQELFEGADLALHRAMVGYWARFATGNDPNGAGALAWPPYTTAGDTMLRFDTTVRTATAVVTETCAFWESLGLY